VKRKYLAALFTLAALAGCASEPGPEAALDAIAAPSWFTAAKDTAQPDADPPRWTRSYAMLPKSASEVDMVYAQALDRAGWRYTSGTCAAAPSGGAIKDDCWTRDGLVLAYRATPMTSGDEAGPAKLEIVLHEEATPSQAILLCSLDETACRVPSVARL
jgi:hypothetical protein